jgi:2-polyprenyl-3-methyl-5-hydroxy-6-metoxy-1,4-benzoquinol methylase
MNSASQYVLGNTEAEHERLARQASRFDPLTERFFREAGIGPGQRVLDLGSGAGDVSMQVSRLVGPSGEVVGVERNADSIAWARERTAKAGLRNVTFVQSDVADIENERPFDALVGRWILMFVPDPVTVLRTAAKLVRSGGAVAFQEPSWVAILQKLSGLPRCTATAMLLHATIVRSGANPELGFALRGLFQKAGLPTPTTHMDTPVGNDTEFASWLVDTLQSVRVHISPDDPALTALGDFDSLRDEIVAEIASSNLAPAWLSLVGAWTRIPGKTLRP